MSAWVAKADTSHYPNPKLLVFFGVFFYALAVGLFIQLVLLPHILPGLDAGHGLLKGGDWVGFHSDAERLAKKIQMNGWVSWTRPPENSGTISFAAAVYALTGISEPWVLLPVYTAVFAIGAVCLFDILCRIAGSVAWALIGICPYVFFASSALIYSQIHKDVWTVAGTLLILNASLIIARPGQFSWRSAFSIVGMSAVAVAFIWPMRPYLLQIIVMGAAGSLTIFAFASVRTFRRPSFSSIGRWMATTMCLAIIAVPAFLVAEAGPLDVPRRTYQQIAKIVQRHALKSNDRKSEWQETSWLRGIDERARVIALYRLRFVETAPEAGSFLDQEVQLTSLGEMLAYVPRALQIGLFAPFPDMWLAAAATPGGGMMRSIAGFEMAVSYVLLLGIFPLWLLRRDGRVQLAAAIAFSVSITVLLVFIFPNVGTLVRMRFPYQQMLLGVGAVGWCAWAYFLTGRRDTRVVKNFEPVISN